MQKFIILHTNDIHGRSEGVARIATLIGQIRAKNPGVPVLYMDAGDCEETSQRLSNLTKGVAMHRLLSAAGCMLAVPGNGGMLRYSQYILETYAEASSYPHLLANLRNLDRSQIEGTQPTALIDAGSCKIGVIGLTAIKIDESFIYDSSGLISLPAAPLVRGLAGELREQGADFVMVLSHMGLHEDVLLVPEVYDIVPLIIGAHTHNLAPAGVWSGKVLITQAGSYAEYLGRIDLCWTGTELEVEEVSVIAVGEDIMPAPSVLSEIAAIEVDIERLLASEVGTLAEPLDYAPDRECGVGDLMADALLERTGAEIAVVTLGVSFDGPLPAGPLKRVLLYEHCSSSANPGVAKMSGEQLLYLVRRGLDPDFALQRPRTHRGRPRGLIHLAGGSVHDGQLFIGGEPVQPERIYSVGGSDWELSSYGGYASPDWKLEESYEIQIIMREVVEGYLKDKGPVSVKMGRVEGELF